MSWREFLMAYVGPGSFSGMTLGDWLRVLRQNRFAVAPRFWFRTAVTTAYSLTNTLNRQVENALFKKRVQQAEVKPPLFVLGIWRSGTTHLHNLIARDERFAFPNMYQVLFPHSFLFTEKMNRRFVNFFMPRKRLQDNVALTVDEPQEEELAICLMTGLSILVGMAFPNNGQHYDRYLTWQEADEPERLRWMAAYQWFIQKLSFKYQRPMVLKSPANTCRIKMLLEMYPDARFVHIHRHPFDVYRSSVHTVRKLTPAWALQNADLASLEELTIDRYRIMVDQYLAEKHLIPPGRFHEIRFEDLESDPVEQMRRMYESLELPDFSQVESTIRTYLQSIEGYRKNDLEELSGDLKDRLFHALRPGFDAWGYAP